MDRLQWMLDKDRSPGLSTLLRQPGSLSCWLKVTPSSKRVSSPYLNISWTAYFVLSFRNSQGSQVVGRVDPDSGTKKPSKELVVGTSLQRTFEYIV